MQNQSISSDYRENVRRFGEYLRVGDSFDLIAREVCPKTRKIMLWYADGLCKEENTEKIVSALTAGEDNANTLESFAEKLVTFSEARIAQDWETCVQGVLAGAVMLMPEGFAGAILVDLRVAPVRGVDEPQSDRVLRGPHDGFVESLVMNATLIRRRIRVPALTFSLHKVGARSKSDVVLCYLNDKVKKKDLAVLQKKLDSVTVDSLTMNQQSLLECLAGRQYWNPFPRVRYTERPDCASACILEGGIIVLMENTPVAMMIPTGVFDFLQDTNDFYMLPFIGTYIRFARMVIILLTLLLIPCWYLFISHPDWIPPWLDFIKIEEPNTVPIFAQLLIVEVVVDALKLASINTPSALNNSFSVLGALVLGEFAVSSGWFVSEVVLYMAFVAITDFAQPNVEFGYTLKLMRMMLLILIRLFSFWGLIGGLLGILLLIATTETVTGSSYLYPLIPFDGKKLVSLFVRKSIRAEKKKAN